MFTPLVLREIYISKGKKTFYAYAIIYTCLTVFPMQRKPAALMALFYNPPPAAIADLQGETGNGMFLKKIQQYHLATILHSRCAED